MSHTPGPWEVEDPMGAKIGLAIVQADLKAYEWEFIAMVQQSGRRSEQIAGQRFVSPKEQAANARLIAAAPEMLEALIWLRTNYASGPTVEINARIDAVVNKAQGKRT